MTQEGAGIYALLAVELRTQGTDFVEVRALCFGSLIEQSGGVSSP